MPSSPRPFGYVYKTSDAIRARRDSYVAQHREAVNASARDLRTAWKASFVGPLWPRGMRRDYVAQGGPTKAAQRAQEVAGRKAARELLKAAKILGRQLADLRRHLEPKAASAPRKRTPEQQAQKTIRQRERRHALQAPRVPMTPEEYRLKRLAKARQVWAEFREAFVGPPKPAKVAQVVPRPPRPTNAPGPSLVETKAPTRAAPDASTQRDQAAQLRAGRAWDRLAVAALKAAVQTLKRLDREARRRAYAVEQERRRCLTPQQRDAELQACIARAEAVRLAALGPLAAQERERIEAAKVAEDLRRKLDAEALAVRRAAALDAVAFMAAPVARVPFVRPPRP